MKREKRKWKAVLCVILSVAVSILAIPLSEERVSASGVREYTIMSKDTTGTTDVFAYYPASKWKIGRAHV